VSRYSRASPAARGYDGAWRKLRANFLVFHPTCELCAQLDPPRLTAASVVDHIQPIREAPERRLDESNLRALCKACHDGAVQAENKTGRMRGAGVDGVPLSADHWWNK